MVYKHNFSLRLCRQVKEAAQATRSCHHSNSHCHFLHSLPYIFVGTRRSLKNCISHIDASHSRQPLVKGERLVRYEVNAVMVRKAALAAVRFFDNTTNFSPLPSRCANCAGGCPATLKHQDALRLAIDRLHCTVAILAQGTSRAVAVTQALFIFVCIGTLGSILVVVARVFLMQTVIAGGHTASNAPDLFRPPKLSGAGPG